MKNMVYFTPWSVPPEQTWEDQGGLRLQCRIQGSITEQEFDKWS